MTRHATLVVLSAWAWSLGGANVRAQSARDLEAGTFELSAGALWMGSASFGSRDATLTSASGGRFSLFSTASELAGASGVEGRVGGRITRLVQVEGSASYTVPQLQTRVSADTEGGGSVTASEPIRQISLEGSVLVRLARRRIGSRGVPFISAGAGYVRQLHDSQILIQAGRTYYAGGGVKFPLVSPNGRGKRLKQLGVRVDARAVVRTGGVTLDGRAHTVPALAASLFTRF